MPILSTIGAAGARGLGLTAGAATYEIDILVVAGGGSGASRWGGAGGGGGLVYKTSHELAAGTEYAVVIGAGGTGTPTGASDRETGYIGIDSTWGTELTAKGGGLGGYAAAGGDGGSGGSAGGYETWPGGAEIQTSEAGDSGTYGFGNDGGLCTDGVPYYAPGGGGGAGVAGQDGSSAGAGDGGNGKDLSADFAPEGDSGWFAGGGGGGSMNYTPWAQGGTGGSGGGTAGGASFSSASSASPANTGGGSGSGAQNAPGGSGNGGSGVVCMKVLTADYSGTVTGSPNERTDGDYTIVEFTGDGSYTA
jgi:hypothetical protein